MHIAIAQLQQPRLELRVGGVDLWSSASSSSSSSSNVTITASARNCKRGTCWRPKVRNRGKDRIRGGALRAEEQKAETPRFRFIEHAERLHLRHYVEGLGVRCRRRVARGGAHEG